MASASSTLRFGEQAFIETGPRLWALNMRVISARSGAYREDGVRKTRHVPQVSAGSLSRTFFAARSPRSVRRAWSAARSYSRAAASLCSTGGDLVELVQTGQVRDLDDRGLGLVGNEGGGGNDAAVHVGDGAALAPHGMNGAGDVRRASSHRKVGALDALLSPGPELESHPTGPGPARRRAFLGPEWGRRDRETPGVITKPRVPQCVELFSRGFDDRALADRLPGLFLLRGAFSQTQ